MEVFRKNDNNGQHLITSTGVPAKLNLKLHSSTTNNGWWTSDESVDTQLAGMLEAVNSEYNLELTEWSKYYSGYFVAYGLEHNFEKIKFTAGEEAGDNSGCYKKIDNKDSGDIFGDAFKKGNALRGNDCKLRLL